MKRRPWAKPAGLYDPRASFLIDREWARVLPRIAEQRRRLDLRLIGRCCIDIAVERGRIERQEAQSQTSAWERAAESLAKAAGAIAEARRSFTADDVRPGAPRAEHWMPSIGQLLAQKNAAGAERARVPDIFEAAEQMAEAFTSAELGFAELSGIARAKRTEEARRSGNAGDPEKRMLVLTFAEAWTYLTGALPPGEKEEGLNPFLPLVSAAWTDLGLGAELDAAGNYPFVRALRWARKACGPVRRELAAKGPDWLGSPYWDRQPPTDPLLNS